MQLRDLKINDIFKIGEKSFRLFDISIGYCPEDGNYYQFALDTEVIMKNDKKNTNGVINFTLLEEIGSVAINQNCTKENIKESIDYYIKL